MAEEITTITIRKDDLGPAKREFDDDLELVDGKGTARVKVFINNKLADAKATKESIIVKAPPRPVKASPRPQEDMLTIVVTTKEEKIIKVIKYEYDPKEKKFRKSAGEPRDAGSASVKPDDSGSALIDAIGDAAQKIADAMAASSVSSNSRPPKTR